MKFAALGRGQWMLETIFRAVERGHECVLIGTCRSAPEYRAKEADFERLARKIGCPFFDDARINEPQQLRLAASSGAEIALSVNWLTVIGAEAIAAFPLGILNAHAGDLPRYRGNACPNWAILNGEPRIGLTVHLMEPEKIDAGPIVRKAYFDVGEETYIGDVYRWLDDAIPRLLVEAMEMLGSGRAEPIRQPEDESLILRCYPRRPEDGRIDWRLSATALQRLVRASSRPFAGAFAYLEDGRRVTIWRASVWRHPGRFCAVPGQVMLRTAGLPVIACGEGCLRLDEVEIEGLDPLQALKEVGRSLRSRLL